MHNETNTDLKPLTPGELAGRYGVSNKTMKTWLQKHLHKIGERQSKYFTTRQVTMIYDIIGPPTAVYTE